jgi:hypothetical protein
MRSPGMGTSSGIAWHAKRHCKNVEGMREGMFEEVEDELAYVLGVVARLTLERDQARAMAVALEQEIHACHFGYAHHAEWGKR